MNAAEPADGEQRVRTALDRERQVGAYARRQDTMGAPELH